MQNLKGLVDSFGLQGFPWAPPANQPWDKLYDPRVYLPINLAVEAARTLGINSVWINTGTFSRMYSNNAAQTVILQPSGRQAMLDGVLGQAKSLKNLGFDISIHLFAEDKSSTSEAIDWSYWQGSPANDASTMVFTTFAHDAATANIPLWLFDSYNH